MEIWRRYNSIIEVSTKGRVKSRGLLLSSHIPDSSEYDRVNISINGKPRKYLVHRLIAKVFIPNPDNKPCINHIDGVKTNNDVNNLEWCTYSENLVHAYELGLRSALGENNNMAKLTELDVLNIRKRYIKSSKNHNATVISKDYNVSSKTILNIVNRKTWKHI